jgi:Caspase domain
MACARQILPSWVLLVACLPLLCLRAAAQPTEHRIALVIGNSDYADIARVSTARNDARSVALELRTRGFVVMEGYDLDRAPMQRLVDDFVVALRHYNVGVFYYAGRVAGSHGADWLIPIGATSGSQPPADLADGVVSLGEVAKRLASANNDGFNLLIIDAHRDHPRVVDRNGIEAPRELAVAAADGVMVLYSPDANQPTPENSGPIDPFTRALLKAMRVPGLPVRELIAQVRDALQTATGNVSNTRTPALHDASMYDASIGNFMFTPPITPPITPPGPVRARPPLSGPPRTLADGSESNRICTSLGTCDVPSPAARPLPDFPWPPPTPSDELVLPDTTFRKTAATVLSLAAVGERIVHALRKADYLEYSFYRVPNGFALVARLERISPDGQPLPSAFRYIAPDAAEPFSFTGYIRSLFFAPEGYYRLIAFVATDLSFVADAPSMNAAGAQRLVRNGANRLPEQLRAEPFTPGHAVTALIYEYRKGSGAGDVTTIIPGRLAAELHLRRARIDLLPGAAP